LQLVEVLFSGRNDWKLLLLLTGKYAFENFGREAIVRLHPPGFGPAIASTFVKECVNFQLFISRLWVAPQAWCRIFVGWHQAMNFTSFVWAVLQIEG